MTIAKSEIETRLLGRIETELIPLELVVVDLDCFLIGHRRIVVFLETVAGQSVSLDQCTTASRVIGELVDQEQISGPYELEVSSAGLDRRLRVIKDFEKYIGWDVQLRLTESCHGRSNVRGTLISVAPERIEVEVERGILDVALRLIRRANLVWKERSDGIRTW